MDVNTLRLILIVVGSLLILLLYLWERHREKEEEDADQDDIDDDEVVDSPYGVRKVQHEPSLGALNDDGDEDASAWSNPAWRAERPDERGTSVRMRLVPIPSRRPPRPGSTRC